MILNEDFFDDNRIEDSDIISSMEPETGSADNKFRFSIDTYYIKYSYNDDTKNITPESVNSLLKRLVAFIGKSTAFSNAETERIAISVLYNEEDCNSKFFFDKGIDAFMGSLPKTVFGIPVDVSGSNDARYPRVVLHVYMDFTANVEFHTPREVADFFNTMMFRDDGMKTFIEVFPLSGVPAEQAESMTFYKGDLADDSFEALEGRFEDGAYIQLMFEKYPLEENSFEIFCRLFMNPELLRRFMNYIKKRGNEQKYPVKRINDILKECGIERKQAEPWP